MDLTNSGRKLTDEDFYSLMNSMVNKSSSFIDELSSAVSNLNPFSAFVQNVPPEARAQIMQPLEQQVEQMPEAPYTNNGTFQSLAGSAQTGGQDVYSGSDPTDYGVAGGEQVSNMDKWIAENAVGAMNLVAQPEKIASGLLDIGSGYYQQATGDITNPEQVEQANQTTQQFKDMFTAEGLHRGPDALALTAGGTYLAGQAGKSLGNMLERSGANKAMNNIADANPGLFPTELGGMSNVVGKSKDMRDIDQQYTAGYNRVNEMDKIKDVTTETSNNNLIDVPDVSIVDLEGKPFITGMADRSEAGKVLTRVNDIELNEGVPLRGGQNYMRNAENYLQGNIWASAPGANTTVLNKANALKESTGQDPLFMPYAMKPTGIDFTHQTTELMINMADTVLNRAQKSSLNKSIKEILPSWKGLASPKLAEILNNTTGNQRKAIQQILDRDFREIGISLPEARVAVSDVDQLNIPDTSFMNIGQLDMNRSNMSNHPSYAQALKGDPVGKIKENISAFDLLTPESLGRTVDQTNLTPQDYRSLTMSAKGGIIDEKILRNLEDKGLLGQIDAPKKVSTEVINIQPKGINQKDDSILNNIGNENANIEPGKTSPTEGLQEQGGVSGIFGMVDEATSIRQQENSRAYSSRQEDGSLIDLDRIDGNAKANTDIQQASIDYANSAGIDYKPSTHYVKVNPEYSTKVANAYDKMPHDPQNPKVVEAYTALIDETLAQYKIMLDRGIKVEFYPTDKDGNILNPYPSPRDSIDDINNNNHLYIFPTDAGFGSNAKFNPKDNPLLATTEFEMSGRPAYANDIFRAVHDYFGHAKEGVGFRASGEENAFIAHYPMYSPKAQKAMATETRGQNSWVNYGPFGEQNRNASQSGTIYADQKINILDDEFIDPNYLQNINNVDDGVLGQVGKDKPVTVYHGTNKEIDELDPSMSGTNQGFDEKGAMFFTTSKDRAPRFSKDYPNKAKWKYTDEDKVAVEKANSLVKEAKLDESNALTMSEVNKLYEQGKIKTKPNTKDLFRAESAWDNNREAIKEASDVTGKKVFKHTAEGETQYAVFDTSKISYNKPKNNKVTDGVLGQTPKKSDKVTSGLLAQEPLVVYRSSTSGSYDKFDKSKQRTSTLGKGVYMFGGKRGANDWVGENLQKIELPYDYMEKSINWGDGGQTDFVNKAFKKIAKEVDFKLDLEDGGIDVYPELVKKLGDDKAHDLLNKHGIYGNRRDDELTVFNVDDAKIISTEKKKAKKGLLD